LQMILLDPAGGAGPGRYVDMPLPLPLVVDMPLLMGVVTMGYPFSSTCDTHGKGTKTNAKPMQNRFSLTPDSARRPLGASLTTFDQRRRLCPGAVVTGDSEKSRSRSLSDKPS
jgi:hypothetical protein